jgi:phosphomannomutase
MASDATFVQAGDRELRVSSPDRVIFPATERSGAISKLDAPKADLIFFDLEKKGNYIAARPSGTEPKVKFYLFGFRPAEDLNSLEDAERDLAAQVKAISADLQKFVDATA